MMQKNGQCFESKSLKIFSTSGKLVLHKYTIIFLVQGGTKNELSISQNKFEKAGNILIHQPILMLISAYSLLVKQLVRTTKNKAPGMLFRLRIQQATFNIGELLLRNADRTVIKYLCPKG